MPSPYFKSDEQRKAVFYRLHNKSGNGKPLNPNQNIPGYAPTHHGAGIPLEAGTTHNTFSPAASALGLTTLPMIEAYPMLAFTGELLATLDNPMGTMLLGSALIAGVTLPMLPGWGQPISYFSVMTVENGATAKPTWDNLRAAYEEVTSALSISDPFENTLFDNFSLATTPLGGSTYGQHFANAYDSSEENYYQTAKNAGITNVPPPNWGKPNWARLAWDWVHGETQHTHPPQGVGTGGSGSMFTP